MKYLNQYIDHNSATISSYLSTIEQRLDSVDDLKDTKIDKMFYLQQVPNKKDNISLLQYVLDKKLIKQSDQLMNLLIKINRDPRESEPAVKNFTRKYEFVKQILPWSKSKLLVLTLIAYYIMYIIIGFSFYGTDLWKLTINNFEKICAFVHFIFGLLRYSYTYVTEAHADYFKDFNDAVQNLSLSCPVNKTDYSMYECWKFLENISKTYKKKVRREQLFF